MKRTLIVFLLTGLQACQGSKINGVLSAVPASSSATTSTKTTTNTQTTTKTETKVTPAKISILEGASYDFGTVIVGATFEKTITLANSGGNGSSLTATLASPFAFKGGAYPGNGATCGTTIKSGESCQLQITFVSSTAVSASGFLTVSYNDQSSNQTVKLSLTAAAQQFSLKQRMIATGTNARTGWEGFGFSVAQYGTTLAITAPDQGFDQNGANAVGSAGAIFVYTWSSGTWALQQKIVASGTNGRVASDNLGYSVSLYEDTLAVGAYRQDYDGAGGSLAAEAGAAYIFTRSGSTWTLQQKIVGSGTNGRIANDQFGYSIALYGDTVAVGAQLQDYDDAGANSLADAGAVYVFTRSGVTWTLQQKIVASGTNARNSSDQFGWAVSLYDNTLAVGVPAHSYDATGGDNQSNAGAAFVYFRTGSTWALQQKITPTGTNARNSWDWFGYSLYIYQDVLAVGAPLHGYDPDGANYISQVGAVFLYGRTGTTWTATQKLVPGVTRVTDTQFGFSICIHGDRMLVGAPYDDYNETGANNVGDAGAAYLYAKGTSSWGFAQKFVGSGTNSRITGDFFGRSVSIYGDLFSSSAYSSDYDSSGGNLSSNAGANWAYGL